MIRTKKRILFVILCLLVVWPLAHVGLVAGLDIDPWKFGGFSKYATPSQYQRIFVMELRGDREINLHDSWFSDDTRQAFRSFRERRAALGKLAPPHDLAEAILAERPDIEGLKIILTRDLILKDTSSIGATPGTAFVYRR